MKKLGKILNAILKEDFFPGPGRPEGPSQKNKHHFHKHPKSSKGVDYYHNFGGSQNWPYEDESDADLNVDLNEFFKFTTSMEDGAMGMGSGITQGSGAPRSYGKGKEPFGKKFNPLDDQIDAEMHDNDMKLQQVSGRNSSRVKPISEFVLRGRERMGDMGYVMDKENPHASGDTGNKNPWTEEQAEDGSIADLEALDEYATDDFSRWTQSHKRSAVDADLHSLDEMHFEDYLNEYINSNFKNFQNIYLESLKDFFFKARERMKSKGILNSLFDAEMISYHPKFIQGEKFGEGFKKRESPMTEEEKSVLESELKKIFDSIKHELFDYYNEKYPDDKKKKNERVKISFELILSLISKGDYHTLDMIKGVEKPSAHYLIKSGIDPADYSLFEETSLPEVIDNFFEADNIKDKNIKNYKSIFDIYQTTQNSLASREEEEDDDDDDSSSRILKKMKKKAQYEKMGTYDGWSVFSPENVEASCVLGANTKWCTAAVKTVNQFETYRKRGKLLIFINDETKEKYQGQFRIDEHGDVHFIELKDAEDVEAKPEYYEFFTNIANNTRLKYYLYEFNERKEIKKAIFNLGLDREAFEPESSGTEYKAKIFELINQAESHTNVYKSLEKEKRDLERIDKHSWDIINLMIANNFNSDNEEIVNYILKNFPEARFVKNYYNNDMENLDIFENIFYELFIAPANLEYHFVNFVPSKAFSKVYKIFIKKRASKFNSIRSEVLPFVYFYYKFYNYGFLVRSRIPDEEFFKIFEYIEKNFNISVEEFLNRAKIAFYKIKYFFDNYLSDPFSSKTEHSLFDRIPDYEFIDRFKRHDLDMAEKFFKVLEVRNDMMKRSKNFWYQR